MKTRLVNLRLDDATIEQIERRWVDDGYDDRSAWLRAVILAALSTPSPRARNATVSTPLSSLQVPTGSRFRRG